MKTLPTDYEQILNLSTIIKGTFLYSLAEAEIKVNGFYTCTYKGIRTLIIK